jgi:hypothetical protein
MRSAPSVVYPAGRCAFYAGLLAVWGLTGLALLIWVAHRLPLETWMAGSALWLMWATVAAVSWRRSPTGRLQWDASATRLADPSQPAGAWLWHSAAYRDGVILSRVERVQDLQRWMLLRLHNPDGARTWVWVEGARDPDRWSDLRRAVVAHG